MMCMCHVAQRTQTETISLLLAIFLGAAKRSKIVCSNVSSRSAVSFSAASSTDLVMKVLSEFYQNSSHLPDARISVLQLIEQVMSAALATPPIFTCRQVPCPLLT